MEFLILFGVFLSIAAWRFRILLWTQGFGRKRFVGFASNLLLAIWSLHEGLHGAYVNDMENQATFGAAAARSTSIDFISFLSQAYLKTDFLLAVFGFIAVIEVCAYVASGRAFVQWTSRQKVKTSGVSSNAKSGIDPFMSRWWANIIVLVGAPAFAFFLATLSPAFFNVMRLDSVADHLQVLLTAYYAPIQALGMWVNSSGWINFTRATPPWLLIALVMTALPLLRKTAPCAVDERGVMQRIFGTTEMQGMLRGKKLRNMPWRGKFLLIYCAVACVLTAISPVLNILGYMVIAILYNLLWIGPALLLLCLLGIVSVLIRKK